MTHYAERMAIMGLRYVFGVFLAMIAAGAASDADYILNDTIDGEQISNIAGKPIIERKKVCFLIYISSCSIRNSYVA